jgi:hypothetical protein
MTDETVQRVLGRVPKPMSEVQRKMLSQWLPRYEFEAARKALELDEWLIDLREAIERES